LQESCVLGFPSGYTSARVVRINWQLANKVACFSRIVSHPIAKSHFKPWSVREHDST